MPTQKTNRYKFYPFATPTRDLEGQALELHRVLTDDMRKVIDMLQEEIRQVETVAGNETTSDATTARIAAISTQLNALVQSYSNHVHPTDDVSGLETLLAGKSDISHTHPTSDPGYPILYGVTDAESPWSAAPKHVIYAYAISGPITINLPSAALSTRWPIIVKAVNVTYPITIDGFGSETIDGALTLVLGTIYDSVTLFHNNSNWFVT